MFVQKQQKTPGGNVGSIKDHDTRKKASCSSGDAGTSLDIFSRNGHYI